MSELPRYAPNPVVGVTLNGQILGGFVFPVDVNRGMR